MPAVFSSVLILMLCVYPLTVLSRWINFPQVHATIPEKLPKSALDHAGLKFAQRCPHCNHRVPFSIWFNLRLLMSCEHVPPFGDL